MLDVIVLHGVTQIDFISCARAMSVKYLSN